MRVFLSLICVFSFALTSFSQEKKNYRVNPGQKVRDAIPMEEIFQYPSFSSGEVYFRNGSVTSAPLNYNNLFAEIQFIDAKKDTLSLSDEQTISYISIGADTFY